jgi:hypothetical protein
MPLLTTLASDALSGYGFSRGGAAQGSFDLISTTLLSTTTSSVTFSSIASTYKHLQLRITARTNDAMDLGGVAFRFNSDTGSNYTYHILDGSGSAVSVLAGTSQTSGSIGLVTGNTSTTNSFGIAIADILDYTNTSKNKTVRSLSGKVTTANDLRLTGSAWLSTSAITSITLIDSIGGSFVSGSRFSLYGIKGA